jgi:hypothetical protein
MENCQLCRRTYTASGEDAGNSGGDGGGGSTKPIVRSCVLASAPHFLLARKDNTTLLLFFFFFCVRSRKRRWAQNPTGRLLKSECGVLSESSVPTVRSFELHRADGHILARRFCWTASERSLQVSFPFFSRAC